LFTCRDGFGCVVAVGFDSSLVLDVFDKFELSSDEFESSSPKKNFGLEDEVTPAEFGNPVVAIGLVDSLFCICC